jgi:hypothetical protein
MRRRFGLHARLAFGLAVTMAGAGLTGGEAHAAPFFAQPFADQPSLVTQAKIYRRGRTPIYPYYYNPGRPGGYSFYFGFVPYSKGQVENQALQRGFYPTQDIEWPEDMRAYGPRPGWGPKAED